MISRYLTDDEIVSYCSMLPVTSEQVMFASSMIDAYIGTYKGSTKFAKYSFTEKGLRPNRKGIVKLSYNPIISIDSLQLCIPNGIGFTVLQDIPVDYINWSDSGYIYMDYSAEQPITPSNLFGNNPVAFNITYNWGYEEIPNKVKVACAMIAMNISQQGGFNSIQSVTTLDTRYALADPSVFTKDVRNMLAEYR